MSGTGTVARVRAVLPRGGRLPDASWRNRHRWIVRLLWAHVAVIPVYGLSRGNSAGHMALESLLVAVAALGASAEPVDRRLRTLIASFGLLSCSGILVHLSDGLIEMHFHYFVMVAVVSLYQDWRPFLAAIAYVFVQHGVFGALAAHSVYNHPDAIAHPWRWAAVHAAFIAAESIACLVNWRLNEALYASEHGARVAAESARADLSLLVDATEALTSSFDVEVMLQGLVALVVPTVADGCVVHLVEEESGRLVRVASTGRVPPGSEAPVLECLRNGTAVSSPAGAAAPTDLVVPLTGRAGVIGALALACDPGTRRLHAGAVQVAAELGRRAGIAVENARLYARERSVALTLQHALLPERLPEIPGLESAARYVAGGPGVDVGGDWYDLIPLAQGRLLVVMGDVVGRGEKAAALMGQLRSALRGHTLVDDDPAALLTHLNHLLNEGGRWDMATLLCARLDPAAGTVSIANAGHPPAALRDRDGSVRWLTEATGPPLGAVVRAGYEDVAAQIPPGSTLVVYTDGLVEDRHMTLDVGLDRLARALAEAPEAVEALCEHVLDRTLADRRASDDAALLAVRLLPLGDRLRFDLPRDVGSLEPVRATLRRWLEQGGATPDETYEILVATCEAAANAIVHAHGSSGSRVQLEVALDGEVLIEVRDSGSWRRPGTGTGGRGLHIMDAFMDDVSIDTTRSGTRVRMRRRLAAQRVGAPT